MANSLSALGHDTHKPYTVFVSVSLVLLVLGSVYFYNLGGWLINDDEGSFLYLAWRISVGERPYQDMLTSHWPLFLYTAAGWMSVVGMNAVLMRALAVSLTLGTALLIFVMARLYVSTEAALLSMVIFLLHPEVFRNGRLFQPEPFYIFFSILGLYFVARGYKADRKVWLFGAGISFAISSLYKILALQVVAGVGLFMVVDLLRGFKSWRSMIVRPVVLFLSYIIPYAGVVTGFVLFVPRTSMQV
jgi:4-amino-4-deoxy-L-arabinose transferase-like glycosyltransferase